MSLAFLPSDCISNIASYVSTISYMAAPASLTRNDLMKDLCEINASIIRERIEQAAADFKRTYSYVSFYNIQNHKPYMSLHLFRSDRQLECLYEKHSITRERLYDMLSSFDALKAAGIAGTFSFFEIRNHLAKEIEFDHRHAMRSALAAIEKRRVEAAVCNGGCKQCGAELPLWWPSAKLHSRQERKPWRQSSMGFYRIGFCSPDCITAFNDALLCDCRIEEPADGILSPKTRYTCQSRFCKREILWTDLESHGWFSFCCDECANREYEERHEDDLMYAKYDRHFGW